MKAILLLFALAIPAISFAQNHQYTIVFLNKNASAPQRSEEEMKKLMAGHTETRERLAKEGKLLAAGPFSGGGGMYILNSTSPEEVKTWIADDAGIKAELWKVEILPYRPRHGGICPVGETYTMTNYVFVRYDAIVSKFNAATYPQLIQQHNEYLKEIIKKGNVITEAIFGDTDGGILIMRGDPDQTMIESDPAVQQGLIDAEIRKLFVAKGSFCEGK